VTHRVPLKICRVLLLLASACCTAKSRELHSRADVPAPSAASEDLKLADRFAKDAAFRRHWLEESVVDRESGYARERLAHYNERDWGSLPVAAFKIRPVLPADLGRSAPRVDSSWHSVASGASPASSQALKQRGEELFARFPARVERALLTALRDKEGPARYGLWQTHDSVGGLVWVALADGTYPALTCSSCHSSVDRAGRLRPGIPNHQLDLGRAKDDDRNAKTRYSTWGPGRVALAPDGSDDPVVIADVRATRLQRHLRRTADLRNSLPALALEVEIDLVLAHARAVRPDRQDAFALAYYVWTLADGLAAQMPRRQPAPPAFARHCGPCHKAPSLAGDSLPVDFMQRSVSNPPGSARVAGRLRTPSLLGVSARHWLLYGGEAEGIEGLLDPRRIRGGHYMAGRLDDDERKAIADYLKAL
jgi:hypothetical protein